MNAPNKNEPWTFPEATWRGLVNHVRAGRSLKPKAWKGGATLRGRACPSIPITRPSSCATAASPSRKISQGQYGARLGHAAHPADCWRKHGVPATFFMPAVSALINPDEAKAVVGAGHELGIHSWIHEFNSKLDETTERDLAFRALDVLEKLTGVRPVGMRTASWDFSPWTLKIVREMGLLYDSSLMADDEPYELLEHGEPTGVVELPVEWIRDDAVYFNMDRMASLRPYGGPEMVFDIFRRELDAAFDEGGPVPLDDASASHRASLAHLDPR